MDNKKYIYITSNLPEAIDWLYYSISCNKMEYFGRKFVRCVRVLNSK